MKLKPSTLHSHLIIVLNQILGLRKEHLIQSFELNSIYCGWLDGKLRKRWMITHLIFLMMMNNLYEMVDPRKYFKFYFHPGPLLEIIIIASQRRIQNPVENLRWSFLRK